MTERKFKVGDRVRIKLGGNDVPYVRSKEGQTGVVTKTTGGYPYEVRLASGYDFAGTPDELELVDERVYTIPMSYIHKGTKLTAKGRDGQVIFATADMDGHSVSTSYGLSQGNTTYLDPQRNYLNVKMDARLESYRAGSLNDSFYERDGWTFLVGHEAHERYQQDLADEKKSKVEREKTDKVRQIQQEIAEAQDKLKNAQAKLDKLGVTL